MKHVEPVGELVAFAQKHVVQVGKVVRHGVKIVKNVGPVGKLVAFKCWESCCILVQIQKLVALIKNMLYNLANVCVNFKMKLTAD